MLLATVEGIASTPKRVLLLHSYGREFAPFNSFSESFRTELAQQFGEPLDFHDAALESARFAGETAETPFTAYLEALFSDRQPDLMISIGGPATRFAQRHRDRLFPVCRTPRNNSSSRDLRIVHL